MSPAVKAHACTTTLLMWVLTAAAFDNPWIVFMPLIGFLCVVAYVAVFLAFKDAFK